MSVDYSIVVRGKKRTPDEIRALAATLEPLGVHEDAFEDEEAEEDDDLGELYFADIGIIFIERLKRGYVLSVDSNNREKFVELGLLVDRLGLLLGKIVEDSDAIERMYAESAPPPRPENASRAVMTLEDGSGGMIETVSVSVEHFAQFVDPGGMPSIAHGWKPPMASEDYRFGKRAAVMRAVMHDSDGVAFRRFVWTLDGYGRIRSVDVTEL